MRKLLLATAVKGSRDPGIVFVSFDSNWGSKNTSVSESILSS